MWILRTDAGEVPSGLGWGFVGGWLLRRWKSAKTAEKNPELAPASLKQLDFFQQRRFPPSKKHTPPAEAEPASILSLGCAFRPERRSVIPTVCATRADSII